jgi:hypothetical protein
VGIMAPSSAPGRGIDGGSERLRAAIPLEFGHIEDDLPPLNLLGIVRPASF